MRNGSIKWNDNNDGQNANQALGALPRGEYTRDTVIFYCCQNRSTWYNVIELPITSPFYLLPYKPDSQISTECQRVKWALAKKEFIKFNTGRENVFNGLHVFKEESHNGLRIYYCYYERKFYILLNFWLIHFKYCWSLETIIKYANYFVLITNNNRRS